MSNKGNIMSKTYEIIKPETRLLKATNLSVVAFLIIVIFSWTFIGFAEYQGKGALSLDGYWDRAANFLAKLFGLNLDRSPAFLNGDRWFETFLLALETLVMSILAISLASLSTLMTLLLSSRNMVFGETALFNHPIFKVIFYLNRAMYIFTRAVPELIWAMLLVFVLSPGMLPGALALAIHNFGVLGKLSSEIIEDIDLRPARALRSSGGGVGQIVWYAIIPSLMPQFLTLIFYRWEVIIRTTVVVGFVSAGGLGREFRLFMSWLQYDEVLLILIWYLILVLFVDLICGLLRKLARA